MAEVPPLVRPRVLSQVTSEQLLLEDFLEPFLERHDAGAICIFGEPGTGKSSALRALSGRLSRRTIVELLDNPDRARVADLGERMIVIYAAAVPHELPHLATVTIASWAEDEALEYLMAAHPDRCASVMTRLRAAPHREPLELPELWTICLDRMAEDDSIPDFDAALRRHLDRLLPGWLRPKARTICFSKTVDEAAEGVDEVQLWGHQGFLGFLMGSGLPAGAVRLIRNPRVRRLLAAEKLVNPDTGAVYLDGLLSRIPQPLLAMAGRTLSNYPEARAALEASIQDQIAMQSPGASLLHAAGTGWRPADEGKICWLWRAHLPGVQWKGLKLPMAQFNGADLTGANLKGSILDGAAFPNACLRHALLSEASLHRIEASDADLEGADLSRALATRSHFVNANLRGADFEGAALQESRFFGADLTGARFCRADLRAVYFQVSREGDDRMNSFATSREALEYLEKMGFVDDGVAGRRTHFSDVDFTGANLQGAWMQGSDLRTCNFSGALLMGANLGGANLEGVTIPGARFEKARLQGAVLTGSVITGASMRGAFLGHAKLADIDWERADLRDADLRKVTFHLGSSRSGLVFGEPSEGTRSGFYTDDFNDQSYRSPEEIRVANLRGADLRGAVLRDTDFYLVDLREALYTPEQEVYLRRCGAILETRV